MRALVDGTDPSTWRDPALREAFIGALDYEVDILRLLSAYRAMFLRQAQWHDTLSADAYAMVVGARRLHGARRRAPRGVSGRRGPPGVEPHRGAGLGVQRADRDLAMAWIARVLLVLALAWLVIGMLSARTRLVGRPGAAAARATWIASTRPWRARESTLGMLTLDHAADSPCRRHCSSPRGRCRRRSCRGCSSPSCSGRGWCSSSCRFCSARRSPYPVIAAVGGVVVLRCIVTLFALSFTGPGGYWFAFWTDPTRRTVYIAVAFALFVWVFVAGGWAISVQIGRRRATGVVLAAVGAGLAIPALVVAVVGLERALTLWNDQIGLLPWGLARILGITTYLEIPADTAWSRGVGVVLVVIGVLLAVPWRRRARAEASSLLTGRSALVWRHARRRDPREETGIEEVPRHRRRTVEEAVRQGAQEAPHRTGEAAGVGASRRASRSASSSRGAMAPARAARSRPSPSG